MPVYLIKNNIKLILRNKWILGLIIIGPIITIAVLSSAFKNMMKSYSNSDEFVVGYRFIENSFMQDYIGAMKEAGANVGITLVEFETGKTSDIIAKNNFRSFVEFTMDSYSIYKLEEYKIEGMTTEYFFHQMFQSMKMGDLDQNLKIPTTKLATMPYVESKDYYGIIYIVYFTWCCFVSLSAVLSSEHKNKIDKKFLVSPVSDLGLFLARNMSCILATLCEMTITTVLATIMFDLHWGNIPYTILILILTVIAATLFGSFVVYCCNNLAVSVVIVFTVVWIAGFFGGSFETYMFSSWSQEIKNLSPIYHINRALVEYSSIGESKYTLSCILYLIGISVLCFVAGILVSRCRKGNMA